MEATQRQNPCLDEQLGQDVMQVGRVGSRHGYPIRPRHLYDEEEELQRQGALGAPKFSTHRGGGGGCPMTSMGMLATKSVEDGRRIYTGAARSTRERGPREV